MATWFSSSVVIFSVIIVVAVIFNVSSGDEIASVFTGSFRAPPYFS